ncbi:MAG TPA: hypothetical protein VKX17_27050 [Planctomycetota bacterium]|nr:hypothetical protein [Planctomycetota bacterium]
MNYKIIIRPRVEADIAEAEAWYELKQPGLGLEFARVIRDALGDFPENPLIHRLRDKGSAYGGFILGDFPTKSSIESTVIASSFSQSFTSPDMVAIGENAQRTCVSKADSGCATPSPRLRVPVSLTSSPA